MFPLIPYSDMSAGIPNRGGRRFPQCASCFTVRLVNSCRIAKTLPSPCPRRSRSRGNGRRCSRARAYARAAASNGRLPRRDGRGLGGCLAHSGDSDRATRHDGTGGDTQARQARGRGGGISEQPRDTRGTSGYLGSTNQPWRLLGAERERTLKT